MTMWPTSLALRALVCIAVVGAILAIGVGSGMHYRGLVADRDLSAQKAAFDARINTAELAKEAAEAKATATEHATATALAAAETNHQKELNDEQAKTAAAVAAYRAGTVRLRYATTATDSGSCRAVGGPAATAGGSDAGTTAELPPALAGALLELAGDADQVVVQLHLAQDTIRAYVKACGAP